jgi:hypothetical protein
MPMMPMMPIFTKVFYLYKKSCDSSNTFGKRASSASSIKTLYCGKFIMNPLCILTMKAENLNNLFRNKVKYSSQEELYEDIDSTIQFIIDTLKKKLPLSLKFKEAERLEEEQAEAEAEAEALRTKDEVAERNSFKLVFKPLNLEVVKKADIKTTLERIYKTDPNIVGMGKVNFYKYIAVKFMNITRDETGAFLDSKMNYQVSRPTN